MPTSSTVHPYRAEIRELTTLMLDTPPTDVLTALAVAERLARRLADLRWPTALAALHRGASLVAVAAALGEDDVEWVAVAVTAWIDQQSHDSHLDRVDHDRLIASLTSARPAAVAG